MHSLLTLGIPTFNRAACVTRLMSELIAKDAHNLVDILVIDDGSSDGTVEALSVVVSNAAPDVRILSNEANRGYAHTFNRIFQECKTDYLMMMADDDSVILDNLPALIEYLQSTRPDFVSPQFLIGDSVCRGRTTNASIKPEEFFPSAAHAPGLVYFVDACRDSVRLVKERADKKRTDALVYPQLVVLINLLRSSANCRWLALPTVAEGEAQPSGIRDATGGSYWSVESRWRQLRDFDELFTFLDVNAEEQVTNTMRNTNKNRLFGHLVTAMQDENPQLRAAFDKSARRFYSKQILKNLFTFSKLSGILNKTSFGLKK